MFFAVAALAALLGACDGKSVAGDECAVEGEQVCAGECVDLASDTNNCGACGTQCRTDQYCQGLCRDYQDYVCPSSRGPAMVKLPEGYCIDSTEVTADQYQEWLATNPSTSGQPLSCARNETYAPKINPALVTTGNQPVVGVDWCDGYAYCAAVGKRLCGKIGGGANSTDGNSWKNPTRDQWFNACSSAGANQFPYGNKYQPMSCNTDDANTVATVPVGTMTECQSPTTGYSGVYDLTGNVREWENSCSPGTNTCIIRGDSFLQGGVRGCEHSYEEDRRYSSSDVGFRCCAP